jgi:hypothetical protein
MADPLPAIAQVEDLLRDLLAPYPGLTGWAVVTDTTLDEALREDQDKRLLIYTVQYLTVCDFESGQTEHHATIEFEAISRTPTAGTINRTNHAALAQVVGAIAPDRTLGQKIQWIEEKDVAPAAARGKDVNSTSLQMEATFLTPHDDWFTLVA